MEKLICINFIMIILFSCSSQKELDIKTIDCFQEKMDDSSLYKFLEKSDSSYTTDFYNSVRDFENILLSEKLLKNNNESGYLEMLNNFNGNIDEYASIYSSLNNLSISIFSNSNTLHKYKICIYETLKNHKNSKYLNSYLIAYEKLENNGLKDIDGLKEIIKLTDFQNEKMRLIMCSLFYSYIWSYFS